MDSQTENKPNDNVLNGYGEWLNDILFANKEDEDTLLWLGENRWLIASNLDPGELCVISVQRATLNV